MPSPKTAKSTETPLRKKIKECCAKLYIVPSPEIINKVEERLLDGVTPTMILDIHKDLVKEISGNRTKTPASAAPSSTDT